MDSVYEIDGLPIRTGDILCMRDGGRGGFFRRLWTAIGALIPGEVDHCALYVGPNGRFIEADIHGVTLLTMPGNHWDADALVGKRLFVDTLVGVAYPLQGRGLTAEEERRVRESVAAYCLAHATADTPFNFNLFNATNPNRAYCSQLIADAYRNEGIELDTKRGVPRWRIFRRAVFPQALWAGSPHRRVPEPMPGAGNAEG
ncbi:hypothetical protein [Lysobacter claricitrinus]|uniref:hypothetical protein n=1 Tax=Lysobacter claricitrinus TaxID=3367728 RepID=UPI0037DB14BD